MREVLVEGLVIRDGKTGKEYMWNNGDWEEVHHVQG